MLNRPPLKQLYSELKELVEAQERTERQCSKYLQYAKDLLTHHTLLRTVYVDTELRTCVGDADWVMSGVVEDDQGNEFVKAYVWELKAPQCPLFVKPKGNEHRFQPSRDLFEAEDQLLQYYDALQHNGTMRDVFGVTHAADVCLGGIIIGRDPCWVRSLSGAPNKKRLYRSASRIRELYIHKHLGIKVKTWDRILDHFKEPKGLTPSQPDTIEQPIYLRSEAVDQMIQIETPQRSGDIAEEG
jgi:hypothetical protein